MGGWWERCWQIFFCLFFFTTHTHTTTAMLFVIPETNDVPEPGSLESLTRDIHTLRRENEILRYEADIAADGARVHMARAQDAASALHENSEHLKVLTTQAANLRLEQAENGLRWQQGRVDEFQQVVDSLPPLADDASDDTEDMAAPQPNLGWRMRNRVNCANVDNSWVLSSKEYSSTQGAAACIRDCDERSNDPAEMFRCSHVVWNQETNTCTSFASLDPLNPSPVDTNNAQVCARGPDATTFVAPGVPCVGCRPREQD